MTGFIPQMEPLISADDIAAVERYMRSGGWLTEFEQTREFARQIAEATGSRFCSVTPNGTLALFLALAATGVGPGDEVIVPNLTMAATATAVMMTGARVVLADIERETLCLDFEKVDTLLTPDTKAVIFVSLNGRAPQSLAASIDRLQERGVFVIEDAAQSLGSSVGTKPLGSMGRCGCLSFSSQKIVTTGQGGAVVTNDETLHHQMELLRDFGRERAGADHYLVPGWNLKFTDLQAVVGVQQMRRLSELIRKRREVYGWYREELDGIRSLAFVSTDLSQVTPWFVDILLEPAARAPLAEHLKSLGIGSRTIYPPLHNEPAFRYPGAFPVSEDVSRRVLWLPSSLRLERSDVARVCGAIRDCLGQ